MNKGTQCFYISVQSTSDRTELFWQNAFITLESKTLHVLQVSFIVLLREVSMALDETPTGPRACQHDRQPPLLIESIQKSDSEGYEMFCRVENEPSHFIKELRQATCGNHPSAVELVVCAGKISLTPSSICHICNNLLFSSVKCCNLAFCCACSLSSFLALKLPDLQVFRRSHNWRKVVRTVTLFLANMEGRMWNMVKRRNTTYFKE